MAVTTHLYVWPCASGGWLNSGPRRWLYSPTSTTCPTSLHIIHSLSRELDPPTRYSYLQSVNNYGTERKNRFRKLSGCSDSDCCEGSACREALYTVEKVYRVGSKAIILDPHQRFGAITKLTNSGAIIKTDADGTVVSATLGPSDDFWYPKQTVTLFFPGVDGATVTLAHERLPQTIEAPKRVPREALGLPPLPVGACDSDAADENNAMKGKKRAVDQNKGQAPQSDDKAIASGSGTTYTSAQDVEARPEEFAKAAFSFSAHTLKSEDNITKESATTSQVSRSSNSETSGSTSTGGLTMTKTMPPTTKRKSDATPGDQSKRPQSENGESPTGETIEDGSKVVNNFNGGYSYHYDLRGGTNTLQLPQVPVQQAILDGHHLYATYCCDSGYGYRHPAFVPQRRVPTAQGAAPVATAPWAASQQAPMPYQVPTPQAGSPLTHYSAPVTPAGHRRTSPQNFQDFPYAMDTRFRQDTSPIASSSRGPGTYSQHPQYPQ